MCSTIERITDLNFGAHLQTHLKIVDADYTCGIHLGEF